MKLINNLLYLIRKFIIFLPYLVCKSFSILLLFFEALLVENWLTNDFFPPIQPTYMFWVILIVAIVLEFFAELFKKELIDKN